MTTDQKFIKLATDHKTFKDLEPLFLQLDFNQQKSVWLNLLFRKKKLINYEDISQLFKQYTFLKTEPEKIFDYYIDIGDNASSKHIAWYISNFDIHWLKNVDNIHHKLLHSIFLQKNNGKFVFAKAAKAYFSALNTFSIYQQEEILCHFFDLAVSKEDYVECIFLYGKKDAIDFSIKQFYDYATTQAVKNLFIAQPEFDFEVIQEKLIPVIHNLLAQDDYLLQATEIGCNFSIHKLKFLTSISTQFNKKRFQGFINSIVAKINYSDIEKMQAFLDYRQENTDNIDKHILLKLMYQIVHSVPKKLQNELLHSIFMHTENTRENTWLKDTLYSSEEPIYINGFEPPFKPTNHVLQTVLKTYLQYALENKLAINNTINKKNKL